MIDKNIINEQDIDVDDTSSNFKLQLISQRKKQFVQSQDQNINLGDQITIKIIDDIIIEYLTPQVGYRFNIPVKFATPELWVKYQLQGVQDKQIPILLIKRGPVQRQYFTPRCPAYYKKNKYDKDNRYGQIIKHKKQNDQSESEQEEIVTYVTDRPLLISIEYMLTIFVKKLMDMNKLIQFFANRDEIFWGNELNQDAQEHLKPKTKQDKIYISIDKNQNFDIISEQYQKVYRMDVPIIAKKYLVNKVREYKPITKVVFKTKEISPHTLSKL